MENVNQGDKLNAARAAGRVAADSHAWRVARLQEEPVAKSVCPVTSAWEKVSIKNKIAYLQKLNDKIFALDPRVVKVSASQSDETSHILF